MSAKGAGAGEKAAEYKIPPDELIKRPGRIPHFDLTQWISQEIEGVEGERFTLYEPEVSYNYQNPLQMRLKKFPRELQRFVNDITNLYTIGEGSCAIHAIFTCISDEWRNIPNISNENRRKLIEIVRKFRETILVDFYERGWTTTRNGEEVDNDRFIKDNRAYLEIQDLRKISEVCRVNMIVISQQISELSEESVDFISGLEQLSKNELDKLHVDWPVIILYGNGGHYETCKYQPSASYGRYILDYAELPPGLVPDILNIFDSKNPAIEKIAFSKFNLDFLIGMTVKLKDSSRGYTVCGIEKILTRGTKPTQYILGLTLDKARTVKESAFGKQDMRAIVPLHFIDFTSTPLSVAQLGLIQEAEKDFTEARKIIPNSDLPISLLKNETNIEEHLFVNPAQECPKVNPPAPVKKYNTPPLPANAKSVYKQGASIEDIDNSNEAALLNDISKAPLRFKDTEYIYAMPIKEVLVRTQPTNEESTLYMDLRGIVQFLRRGRKSEEISAKNIEEERMKANLPKNTSPIKPIGVVRTARPGELPEHYEERNGSTSSSVSTVPVGSWAELAAKLNKNSEERRKQMEKQQENLNELIRKAQANSNRELANALRAYGNTTSIGKAAAAASKASAEQARLASAKLAETAEEAKRAREERLRRRLEERVPSSSSGSGEERVVTVARPAEKIAKQAEEKVAKFTPWLREKTTTAHELEIARTVLYDVLIHFFSTQDKSKANFLKVLEKEISVAKYLPTLQSEISDPVTASNLAVLAVNIALFNKTHQAPPPTTVAKPSTPSVVLPPPVPPSVRKPASASVVSNIRQILGLSAPPIPEPSQENKDKARAKVNSYTKWLTKQATLHSIDLETSKEVLWEILLLFYGASDKSKAAFVELLRTRNPRVRPYLDSLQAEITDPVTESNLAVLVVNLLVFEKAGPKKGGRRRGRKTLRKRKALRRRKTHKYAH